MDRQAAGGALGEYYSEADTRVPTWIVAGDSSYVAELTGLSDAVVEPRGDRFPLSKAAGNRGIAESGQLGHI
jgi:hypothetical protein